MPFLPLLLARGAVVVESLAFHPDLHLLVLAERDLRLNMAMHDLAALLLIIGSCHLLANLRDRHGSGGVRVLLHDSPLLWAGQLRGPERLALIRPLGFLSNH